MKLYPNSITASNNPYGSFYQHFKAVDDADSNNPVGEALSAVWSFSAGTTGLSMSGEADNRPLVMGADVQAGTATITATRGTDTASATITIK